MRFKVLTGKHTEKGKTYKQGEVVETDRPLATIFRNKFEVLAETPAPVPAAATAQEPPPADDNREPLSGDPEGEKEEAGEGEGEKEKPRRRRTV